MGLRVGQVKTRMNYYSQSVCTVPCHKVHPYPHARQTRHQPPARTVKSSLLRPTTKQSAPQHHHPPQHHLLPLAWHQSLPTAPLPRAPRVVLLAPALLPAPSHPLTHLLHLDVPGWDAQFQGLAGRQIFPTPEMLLLLNCHLPRHWY